MDRLCAPAPAAVQALRLPPGEIRPYCPILKEENGGKRKLSKRKDPEAAVTYYDQMGIPAAAVNEYMMTIANSNFEDWRRANPTADLADFPLT